MRTRLLVVANRTVDAPELLSKLRERAEAGPLQVTLAVPTSWEQHVAAERRAQDAVNALKEAGIEAEYVLGDADPICAVQDVWDPRSFDEVLVVTLPVGTSRWLQADLPHRVAKYTDATVKHIEVRPEDSGAVVAPRPPKQRDPLLVRVLAQLRAATRSSGS